MGNMLYRCQKPACKVHPEWSRSAVIYELNTRQFSPAGDFKGVMTQLPRLKDLGVDIIWMMPIYPIGQERRKGELGSYYSIRDYCAVNPEFGTMEEFKEVVNQVHNLGMRVILDWVPNHTSRDAVWTRNVDWYKFDEAKGEIATPFDWSDTAQLDYDSQPMRCAMVEALKFWLTEVGVDGFRVDMAMLVPIDFWNDTVPELQSVRSDIFMLAEAEGPEFHSIAFDATYTWEVHHLMTHVAQGAAPVSALRDRLTYESLIYPIDSYRMFFTSNHDENTWNGSEFQRFGASSRAMAALTYILPGMPLMYNGQEVGSKKSLEFFDRDPIDWTDADASFTEFYVQMNDLKHSHPALAAGDWGGDLYAVDNSLPDKVLSLKRKIGDRVVFGLFNCSGDHADLEFYDADFDGIYTQVGDSKPAELHSNRHFYLPPWGYYVYHR